MSELGGRSLVTCPEAYSKSFKRCYACLESGHPTLECIESHVVTLIGDFVCDRLEDQSPFCILSVGSGDGDNDLAFIKILRKLGEKGNKVHIFERAIEPDERMLEVFQTKADHLPESLKSRANIEFEWNRMTYQEYVEQKKEDDVKFDVVHFFHSLYYTELETALKHCYEKELGTKGVILCTISRENSAYIKYGRMFSSQGMILNPGAYYSNRDVKDVAEKNGWKYVECSGESKTCDITAIFDDSSQEGNQLLDFLTHWVDVRATASEDGLRKILNFWENESVDDGHGKKVVVMKMGAVIIFKGAL
ncbi:histamine N-methyltransferase-like [Oculina patagonica]